MKRTLFLGLAATALVLGAGVAAGYSLSNAPIEAKADTEYVEDYWYAITDASKIKAGVDYLFGYDVSGTRYYTTGAVASSALTTTSDYDQASLIQLETSGTGFKIKMLSPADSTKPYVTNSSSGNISMTSGGTVWTVDTYGDDDTPYFKNTSNNNRFLGRQSGNAGAGMKAYAATNISSGNYPLPTLYYYEEPSGDVELQSISVENIDLKVGLTTKPAVTFNPATATNRGLAYEITEGGDVASVATDGTITGLKAGTATLKITPSDTHATAVTCTVTVEDHPEVEGVEVGKKYAIYGLGEGNAELSGISGTLGSAEAFTGDVPSCDHPFTVVAGAVKNTVAFYDNATEKYLEYSGTANELHEIDSVTMASSWTVATETIEEDDILVVRNALNNSRVLSYNYNKGNSRFACYSNTNQTMVKFFEIVEVALTDFTIDETLEVRKGTSETINVVFDPANATDKSLTWTSSDETVATVDSNGKVTGVAIGTATIKASKELATGKVERECTVTVTKTFNHAGTLADPYDVADAKTLAKNQSLATLTDVYVKGILTKFEGSPKASNCSLWIGDDETQVSVDTGGFEFYKIASLTDDSFAALKVGATIVGKGEITLFGTMSTPEFKQGCTIEYNSYAEALDFGGDFINDLATICAVTKDSASGEAPAQLKTAWGTLATAYGNLSEVEQAHIISATADEAGDNVEKAVALYDYAVEKYTDLDKFITTRVSSLGNLSNNRVSNGHNNAAWIIVAVLGVSAIVAGSVVIIAKKRRAE